MQGSVDSTRLGPSHVCGIKGVAQPCVTVFGPTHVCSITGMAQICFTHLGPSWKLVGMLVPVATTNVWATLVWSNGGSRCFSLSLSCCRFTGACHLTQSKTAPGSARVLAARVKDSCSAPRSVAAQHVRMCGLYHTAWVDELWRRSVGMVCELPDCSLPCFLPPAPASVATPLSHHATKYCHVVCSALLQAHCSWPNLI